MNKELAEALVKWGDHDEADFFVEVTDPKITGTSRWHLYYSQIWQDQRDKSFWNLTWRRGATEMQDDGFEDIEFEQVEPREVTITDYFPTHKPI